MSVIRYEIIGDDERTENVFMKDGVKKKNNFEDINKAIDDLFYGGVGTQKTLEKIEESKDL